MQQSESPGGKLLSTAPITLLVLIVLLVNVAAQTTPEELKPGEPVERELKAAASHSYRVALAAGQYLNVAVEQRGINVEVSLADPRGRVLISRDWWWREGTERLWALADASGDYTLKVSASNQPVESGTYLVKVEKVGDWQQASAAERDLITAHKLSAEGEELLPQGTAESLRKATEKLQAALALWRSLKDGNAEAQTLFALAFVQYSSGNLKQAIELTSQALALFRAAGNQHGEVRALSFLITFYNFSGETQKALESYNQGLPLARAIKDYMIEGEILGGFGLMLNRQGQTQKALETFNELASLSRARGMIDGEAAAHNNLGLIYIGQGRLREAIEHYSQTLALLQKSGDKLGRATTLNNIGNAYTRLGEFQKALDYLLQGLELARALGDRRREAYNLASIGFLYIRLGDYEKALQYYNQSLALCRSLGIRDGEHTALSNLGTIHDRIGELPKALEYYTQAQALAVPLKNRSGEASNLAGLASVYNRLGDRQKALEYYDQALKIRREIGDQYGESYTLLGIGVLYAQLANPPKALEYFNQALTLARSIGDRLGEAANLYQLARIQRAHHQIAEARSEIEAALNVVESIRTKVSLADVRATYFASRQEFYDFYIDLLMQSYESEHDPKTLAEALRANERRSARTLLDSLTEMRANIRAGVAAELIERESQLRQDLNAKADQQVRLLSRKHTAEQAAALAKEIETLATEYEQALAQVRQTSPRYAALTQPVPLDLKQMQAEVLDADTLLLEYALGEEASYLWAVTPATVQSYKLAGRAEIEAVARQVYEALTARSKIVRFEKREQRQARLAQADANYLTAATALSRMILGPVAGQLGRKRLLIVSGGALQYVPLAALPIPTDSLPSSQPDPTPQTAGYRPLILEHEIVSLPSASVLLEVRKELGSRQPGAKTVAVFADPVFQEDDPRVRRDAAKLIQPSDPSSAQATESPQPEDLLAWSAREIGELGFARLPHSRQEAEAILAVTPKGTGKELLDFQASRTTATSSELSRYRIVHFATHGLLNSQHPELSGIVLSLVDQAGQPQDGFLRLHDIYNLKLGADLVVLSACRTALGKEINGEGLVGLTRGFMYAGAGRVVASLWGIDDEATAALMRQFYREMLIHRQPPAAALRAAQIWMWKVKRLPPSYWAAFVLQGEWR
jgi:CHAT domain-containing protein/tetratricopeptide (TPR) repeat protein